MNRVLVLSGTCGSGKSTIAQLLADEHGWTRLSEDLVWRRRFHKNRGVFGSAEHRRKRRAVRRELLTDVRMAAEEADVVVDATVHEADPSSLAEYAALLAAAGLPWQLRVLHPRLEVAIERDAMRPGWHAGAARVEDLWRKFSGRLFDPRLFIDSSGDEPRETTRRVLSSLSTELPPTRRETSFEDPLPPGGSLHHATPSLFDQRHLGRVLRPSRDDTG